VLFELLGTGFANDSYVSLVEALEKAEKQLARCGTFVDLLAQLKYEQVKEYEDEFATNHEMWLKLDSDAKKLLHNAVKDQPVHAVQPLEKEVAKPISSLCPDTLLHDSSMSTLRHWTRQFIAYHSASKMATLAVKDQQAFLFKCLDSELAGRLSRDVTATTAVVTGVGDTCLDYIRGYFQERHPLLIRRKQFFSLRQKEGQDEIEFREELRSLAEEADIENIKYEDCVCLMYMIGLRDGSLREKLAEGEPALARFNLILEAHVQAKISTRPTPAHVNKTKPASSGKGRGGRQQPRERERVSDFERARRSAFRGKCWRCGQEHFLDKCTLPSTVKCDACNNTGHLSKVCIKGQQARAVQGPAPSPPQQLQLEYDQDSYARAQWLGPARADWTSSNRPTPELPL
jgi:hypothetical protein